MIFSLFSYANIHTHTQYLIKLIQIYFTSCLMRSDQFRRIGNIQRTKPKKNMTINLVVLWKINYFKGIWHTRALLAGFRHTNTQSTNQDTFTIQIDFCFHFLIRRKKEKMLSMKTKTKCFTFRFTWKTEVEWRKKNVRDVSFLCKSVCQLKLTTNTDN